MAFESKNLTVLAYSNGFTLWHYATVDTPQEVDNGTYFSEAADMLRTGDMIMANMETDGDNIGAQYLVKSSNRMDVELSLMLSTDPGSTD